MGSPLLDVTREYLAEYNIWECHDGKEPLWDYVRCVLTVTLSHGDKVPADEALEWAEDALAELGEEWMSFQGVNSNDEGRTDFYMAYQRAKCPAGKDPLGLAWERAQDEPMNFAHVFPSENFGKFLDLCFYLQKYVGEGLPIALPVDGVAATMGVTRKTVCNWRKIGKMEGFLEPIADSISNVKSATFLFHQRNEKTNTAKA